MVDEQNKQITIHKAVNSRILKFDEEKRLVKGVVLEPDTVDLQGDIILKETIEHACYSYMEKSRIIGFRHKEQAKDVVLVENYIPENDTFINNDLVKAGSWVIALKVYNNEIWNAIKGGELNSFSIGGWGERMPIDESQLTSDEGGG